MKQVVIENPIINSPFTEPACHYRFTDEGITNKVVEERRSSAYFVPIAKPRSQKGAKQESLNIWTEAIGGQPKLPKVLQGALHSLYDNYKKYYLQWENNSEARAKGQTPPVMIVECNNTNVSKLVFDFIAGWEKQVKG